MKLVVFSHKLVWQNPESPSGYATDGGFAFQMEALSKIFEQTILAVPVSFQIKSDGEIYIEGNNLSVYPLQNIDGHGLMRKIKYLTWLLKNLFTFNKLINEADAIHVPIPSDIGTLGMVLAKLKNKPLYIRYCGNWFLQKTIAERFWKWFTEKYAGGNCVVLATGLEMVPPSNKNPNIGWVFSTSMTEKEILDQSKDVPSLDIVNPRLITVCRMEFGKGVDRVIEATAMLKNEYPGIHLDVVGEGSALTFFKDRVIELGIEKKVSFHGKLNHIEILNTLKKSHVFCFPTDSEGFPKVVLEALASGVPVFATPVSAIKSLLERGGGVPLENVNPETLARELRDLFKKPEVYVTMQKYALETAKEFSLEKWCDVIKFNLQKAWDFKQ